MFFSVDVLPSFSPKSHLDIVTFLQSEAQRSQCHSHSRKSNNNWVVTGIERVTVWCGSAVMHCICARCSVDFGGSGPCLPHLARQVKQCCNVYIKHNSSIHPCWVRYSHSACIRSQHFLLSITCKEDTDVTKMHLTKRKFFQKCYWQFCFTLNKGFSLQCIICSVCA